MNKIGVLALQGDFFKHQEMIEKTGYEAIEVRTLFELQQNSALIIPGGESTTMIKLIDSLKLRDDIINFAQNNPVMGTCAGLILLAKNVDNLPYSSLGLIDISVQRNAYGRQKESFVDSVSLNLNGKPEDIEGVFIRAPKIESVGKGVKVLAYHKNDIVMAEYGNILVCSFHPELTENDRIHRYFLNKIKQ